MKKTLQYLSTESLERSSQMSTKEIVQFLEDFRTIHSQTRSDPSSPSRLISLKVPENLLRAFKIKAEKKGWKYQTLIKHLMKDWFLNDKD
jgi:predicted DNA binding CopG/RHH family protein